MHVHARTDVVFALTGDVRTNSRALRQLHALSDLGLQTCVISLGDSEDGGLDVPNASLVRLEPPQTSGPRFFRRVHKAVREAAAIRPARVYHASDLYVLPALSSAARTHGGRIVYDARELYPYVASTVGRPWVRLLWLLVERSYIRKADAVFTVSDGIADKLVELYGVPRPTVVHNASDPAGSSMRRSLRIAPDRSAAEAVILHQGQMRKDRGCELLVDAMRDVENAILVFLGSGPLRPELEKQASEAKISSRVRFVDPVPPSELLAYTSSADIGVTLLEDTCLNHYLALPNKLFEYLAANVPVIATDLPEIRNVVKTYDVGLLVQPGDRDDLVAALNQAILDKSLRERWRRNIPAALETFNWTAASEHFLHVYQKLLRESP